MSLAVCFSSLFLIPPSFRLIRVSICSLPADGATRTCDAAVLAFVSSLVSLLVRFMHWLATVKDSSVSCEDQRDHQEGERGG
jgi:ABC-type Fe3+ transport system permease subunit